MTVFFTSARAVLNMSAMIHPYAIYPTESFLIVVGSIFARMRSPIPSGACKRCGTISQLINFYTMRAVLIRLLVSGRCIQWHIRLVLAPMSSGHRRQDTSDFSIKQEDCLGQACNTNFNSLMARIQKTYWAVSFLDWWFLLWFILGGNNWLMTRFCSSHLMLNKFDV